MCLGLMHVDNWSKLKDVTGDLTAQLNINIPPDLYQDQHIPKQVTTKQASLLV